MIEMLPTVTMESESPALPRTGKEEQEKEEEVNGGGGGSGGGGEGGGGDDWGGGVDHDGTPQKAAMARRSGQPLPSAQSPPSALALDLPGGGTFTLDTTQTPQRGGRGEAGGGLAGGRRRLRPGPGGSSGVRALDGFNAASQSPFVLQNSMDSDISSINPNDSPRLIKIGGGDSSLASISQHDGGGMLLRAGPGPSGLRNVSGMGEMGMGGVMSSGGMGGGMGGAATGIMGQDGSGWLQQDPKTFQSAGGVLPPVMLASKDAERGGGGPKMNFGSLLL